MLRILPLLLFIIVAVPAFSQDQFETLKDSDGTKIIKGLVSQKVLETDTAFSWYATGKKYFKPDTDAILNMKKNADSIQYVVFMGTWCEDSHFVIPKFFLLTDAAGIKPDHISLVAVDRNKKAVGHLSEALNVTNVPTIIVMKKGKEIGRVVEYGKSGQFDKELGQLLVNGE